MNEQRIRELEDQCWVKVPCDFDMYAGGSSTIRTVFDRKKFAELIVRECIGVIGEENYTMLTGKAYCTELKRHFGV